MSGFAMSARKAGSLSRRYCCGGCLDIVLCLDNLRIARGFDDAVAKAHEALHLLGDFLNGEGGVLGVARVWVRAKDDSVAHQRLGVVLDSEADVRAVEQAFVVDVEGFTSTQTDGGEEVVVPELLDVRVFTDGDIGHRVFTGVDEDGFVVALGHVVIGLVVGEMG